MDFVWKAVNVALLVAIIYKFAKKPVGAALNRSAESAKQTVDDARDAETKITAELSEMRIKIAELEKEALVMVDSAKKDAEDERELIIEEGKREIVRMRKQASFSMQQELRKAEEGLRYWIAEESVKLAEGKIKKEINQNHQTKLVRDYMDQLNLPEGAV